MTIVQLSEVAKVDSGAGFPLEYQGCQGELFPFLKVSDMNLEGNERRIHSCNHSVSESIRSQLRAKAFPVGSLIFPKIGAAIGTNKKRQLIRPSCVDNNVMAVVPDTSKLNPDYLYFAFLAKNISDFASASNPPSIRKPDVENWKLPVPSLGEQVRVVEILTRAESIVRLRRQAQQKAAELVPSIFLEMFGDPRTNSKNLPVYALGELMLSPPTLGTMAKPSADKARWLDLRVANIQGGMLTLEDQKWLDLSEQEINRFQLVAGDVILARAIGSLDHLGKAVVVYPDGDWTFDSHLMRLRLDAQRILPEWFVPYLSSVGGRAEFLKHTRHSAVQFNINGKEIRKLQIPLPSLDAQRFFCMRTEEIRNLAAQQAIAMIKAEAAFGALLARAFS